MLVFHPITRQIYVESLITVYDFERPMGFYFPGETHNFWECVFVQKGTATATADERVYQLEAGQLLIHKPMEFHRMWTEPDCAPWIANVSFHARGELLKQLEGRCFSLTPMQQDQYRQIVDLMTQIIESGPYINSYQYELDLHQVAYMLEVFLLGLVGNDHLNRPRQNPNDERYRKIVQVMQDNCHKNLSLEEIADMCEMSISNMKRVFHIYSDVGIAKYFLTLKIRKAMELLDADVPANQVATELNFPDVAYFYTVFKRETGITPTQYRQTGIFRNT